MILGFIIDVGKNIFSFAWRVGVGCIFQAWLYKTKSINWTTWTGKSLGGNTGAGVCFLAVCVTIGIVLWTIKNYWLFDDDSGSAIRWGLIKCILLSLVTIVCVAVVPIMATV